MDADKTGKGSIVFASSNIRHPQVRRRLLWTALALFIASLALPAVSSGQFFRDDLICRGDVSWARGWSLLLMGLLGPFVGQFEWLANLLMLLAVATAGSSVLMRALCLVSALAALALTAVTPFTFTSVKVDGGVPDIICSFGPGYYLWLACSVLVLIASLLNAVNNVPRGVNDKAEPVENEVDGRPVTAYDRVERS